MMSKDEREIEAKLEKLPTEFIVLIISSADVYSIAQEIALRVLIKKKDMCGVYVTFNRPYSTLKESVGKQGLDLSKLFFIDLITESAGGKAERSATDRCFYVSSPKNLTELSILMEQAMLRLPRERRFVFIDSISTMLIYNDPDTVLRFIHSLTGKMRLLGITGIIFLLEKESDEKFRAQISQFCDTVITI
ncbi:MAG: ATPase domain-containing protein [Candidatus Micrarchaeia archaeon]